MLCAGLLTLCACGDPDNSDHSGDGAVEFLLPGGESMRFVRIEPGVFTMGSSKLEPGRDEDEHPQRLVRIPDAFYLGQTEITQRQWASVMGTRPWAGQRHIEEEPDDPASYLSWDDVQAMAARLNEDAGAQIYRLPTEAEWEWCCRAGSLSRYSHGDDESLLKEYAVYALDHPTPPSKRTANGLGLFDMQGNVWEWCHDTFAAYTAESTVDPVGPHQGNSRSLRGGGYYGTPLITRSAVRLIRTPNSWYSAIGFRIACTFE